MRKHCSVMVVFLLTLVLIPRAALAREYSEKEENQLGKEAAADLEKDFKIVNNPEQLKRIDTILKTIAPVTERPKLVYHPKILDTKDVNALSIPGGYVYVTKGMLDTVESDDELAGVLAHEVAHNTLKHSLKQLDKSAKIDQQLMLVMMTALLVSRDKVDAGSLLFLGQVLKLNALNGYGRDAEFEADHAGVEYLVKSKRYRPVGMLQFMQQLALEEGRRPKEELGIFRTHPATPQRVERIKASLVEHGISPDERVPGKSTPIATARAAKINDKEIAEVLFKDRVIFQPAACLGEKKPLQRAEDYARRLSDVFREYAETRHVRTQPEGETQVLYYRDNPLLVVTPEDARFHGATPEELVGKAAKALKSVIWEDDLRRSY